MLYCDLHLCFTLCDSIIVIIMIVQFHRSITEPSGFQTHCQIVCLGFFVLFFPGRPTSFPTPKHGPASGSSSKFKPEQGQLLLQPLPLLFTLLRGLFLSQASSLEERSVTVGEAKGGRRWQRSALRISGPGSQWSDWQRWSVGTLVWDYSVSGIYLWSSSQVEVSRWRPAQTPPQSRSS